MSHHKALRDGIRFVIPETESAVVVVWYERRGQTWRRNGGLDMCFVWRCSSNSGSARGSYNTGQWLHRRGRFSDLSKCMTQMLFLCCWTVPVEGSHRSFVSIATHVNDIADFKPLIIWRMCCCVVYFREQPEFLKICGMNLQNWNCLQGLAKYQTSVICGEEIVPLLQLLKKELSWGSMRRKKKFWEFELDNLNHLSQTFFCLLVF